MQRITQWSGYAWNHDDGANASVSVWIDRDGTVTGKFYNLSDHTGDHPLRKTGKAKPHWELLCRLAEQALDEARQKRQYALDRERDSDLFPYATLITWGRGGHTVYHDHAPDSSARTQGYGLTEAELAEIDRVQIPFIDSRTIPEDRVGETVHFPMFERPDRCDAPPWGPLSYAPLGVVAALYAQLGATVRHIDLPEVRQDQLRGYTLKEAALTVGWANGNTELIGQAMLMEVAP